MEFVQRSKFAKKVGMHANTIDSWFKEMESKGVHFVNMNERKEKVYDELDLEIALFIKEKRKDNEYTIPGAVEAVREEFAGRLRVDIIRDNDEKQLMPLDELKKEFMAMVNQEVEKRMQAREQELEKRIQSQMQQQLLLTAPDPQEERAKKTDYMITMNRIQAKLKREAIDEWNRLPEDERMVRMGFLKLQRVENSSKRQEFIDEYVGKHFEDRIRSENDDSID